MKRLGRDIKLAFLFVVAWGICRGQYWQPQSLLPGVFHRYDGGFYGGGLSFADFDKDGWDDVLLSQNGSSPLLLKSVQGILQPWNLGIAETGEIKQLSWVDFDNDGDRDLSLTGFDIPIQLFLNESDSLIPLTFSSGIPIDPVEAYGHSWADYDRDGDLDLFVCTYDAAFMGYGNNDNRLYRNEGNSVFTDVTQAAGFMGMVNYSFMAIWMDYNRDLYPDLFVTNDRYTTPNYFYHNNGDGTFTEISAELNLDDYLFAMTATSDDFDNDGDLDIYITNGTAGNYHKVNTNGIFLDANEQYGTTINRFCWGALFVDANRDGLQDLHICTTPHISLLGQNLLYQNNGDVFELANDSAGIAADGGWSHSNALGDFNRDGLADLVVCKDAPNYSSFWRAVPNANHWLKVTLEGVVSNRDGVSSWIDCFAASGMQSRYTFCGEGYLTQCSFSEFFGLGSNELIDSLVVHWPSGIVDRWYRIPANQQLHLVEGSSREVIVQAPNGYHLCGNDTLYFSTQNWSEVNWNTGDSSEVVSIHASGALVASATDEWGNVFVSDTIFVTQFEGEPEPFVMSAQANPVSCYGASDGQVEISYSGGIPNYHLLADSIGLSQLSAGQYDFAATDANGCQASISVAVTEPSELSLEIESTAETDNLVNGTITAAAAGGTPPYSFFLNGSNTATSNWDQLASGTYWVEVQDSLGCIVQAEIIVDVLEGVSETEIGRWVVYPNPVVKGEFISFESSEYIEECRLMNSQGRFVMSFRPAGYKLLIDSAQLPSGCYTLVMEKGCARLMVLD